LMMFQNASSLEPPTTAIFAASADEAINADRAAALTIVCTSFIPVSSHVPVTGGFET
jgi:hypothetical protein